MFNEAYIIQAITLYHSFRKYNKTSVFIFACLSDKTRKIISSLKLNNILIITIEQLDQKIIKKIKKNRPLEQFYWTLKSIFFNFILNNNNDINYLIYLDSDMFFLNSIEDYITANKKYDVILTPHNFSKSFMEVNKNYNVFGKFNAGCLIFKCTKNSKLILSWWMKKCIADCSVNYLKGKLGDQKYLDIIYKKQKNILCSENIGLNLGPWNFENFNLKTDKCILFHYQGLKIINYRVYNLYSGKIIIRKIYYEFFYKSYLYSLKKSIENLVKYQLINDLKNIYSPTHILIEFKKFLLKQSNLKILIK